MFDSHAARLQQHALEALSDLRSWIWERHGALLPDDLGSITREAAERYVAHLDWFSLVEEVMLALAASAAQATAVLATAATPAAPTQPATPELPAAPATPQQLEALLGAPTVRAPSSHGGSEHALGWQRVVAVSSTLSPPEPGFRAA